mgnify:CR=1 FL=1
MTENTIDASIVDDVQALLAADRAGAVGAPLAEHGRAIGRHDGGAVRLQLADHDGPVVPPQPEDGPVRPHHHGCSTRSDPPSETGR